MLWSKVDTTEPANPVTFSPATSSTNDAAAGSASTSAATLAQIVKQCAPEFSKGSSFLVNPLLANGHIQTAYTAFRKFGSIDLLHYGRRLITVDPDSKGYVVDGETLLYDKYHGESTFTIDIVRGRADHVNPESSSLTVAEVLASDDLEQGAATAPDSVDSKSTTTNTVDPASQDLRSLPPRTLFVSEEEEQRLLGDASRPLLIALHGLSGGSYESYVRAVLSEITAPAYGFDAMVINSRGCAGHTPTTPQLFNGLWTNDVRYLVNEYVRKKYPDKKIFLMGFSLGGAICANFLAQEGDGVYPNVMGAAIMGAPWDFVDSNVQLDSSLLGDKVYSPVMSQNLQKLLDNHRAIMAQGDQPNIHQYFRDPSALALEKLHDFDEAFTSKFFGFNNHKEYYRHAGPAQRLRKVRVPIVIVSSLDDPIVGSKTLPYYEVRDNPYAFLVTSTIGGHLGWFKIGGDRWYAQPVAKIFHELFTNWRINKVPDTAAVLPRKLEQTVWRHDRLIVE